jgi:serine/threonine-protein kinase RsbW
MASDAHSVRDGLQRALRSRPFELLAPADRNTAEIVLAEVLNNIVEHAYSTGPGPIRLWFGLEPGQLCVRIEDEGRPMPGNRLPAGQLPLPADLAEGGFGWHLIRSLSTDLRYDRCGGVNRLCFRLPAEQSAG